PMDSRQSIRQALQEQLADHGWGRIAIATHTFPGGPSEEWTLESLWSPRGLRARLSLTSSANGDGQLQVGVPQQPPVNIGWDDRGNYFFVLRSRRRQELAQVFSALTDWRDWNTRQQLLGEASQTVRSQWDEASAQAGLRPTEVSATPTVEEMAWLSC